MLQKGLRRTLLLLSVHTLKKAIATSQSLLAESIFDMNWRSVYSQDLFVKLEIELLIIATSALLVYINIFLQSFFNQIHLKKLCFSLLLKKTQENQVLICVWRRDFLLYVFKQLTYTSSFSLFRPWLLWFFLKNILVGLFRLIGTWLSNWKSYCKLLYYGSIYIIFSSRCLED